VTAYRITGSASTRCDIRGSAGKTRELGGLFQGFFEPCPLGAQTHVK
jgi:hypothetical protein